MLRELAPALLFFAIATLAVRAIPLLIMAQRHGWRILIEDEESRWQRRTRERESMRKTQMDDRDKRRRRFEMATRRRSNENRRDENEDTSAPDVRDPSLSQDDWVRYLSTPFN